MGVGDIVEHKNKESESGYPHDGIYAISSFGRMKNSISREWEDAVIYTNTITNECYIRELNDFIDKFQKIKV